MLPITLFKALLANYYNRTAIFNLKINVNANKHFYTPVIIFLVNFIY
jgi:hypothetical protein